MIVSPRSLAAVSALALVLGAAAPVVAQEAPKPAVPAPQPVPAQDAVPAPPAAAAEPAEDGEDGEDGEGPDVEVETDAPPVEPEIVPIPAVWAPVPRDEEGRTAYGLYLGGRYLVGRGNEVEGDGAQGASVLVQALDLTPEQPTVAEQTFVSVLMAGDVDAAVRVAPSGDGVSPTLTEAARLVAAVAAFDKGDARRGAASLKSRPIGPPHAAAARLVQPWIAAAARDWDFALAAPDAAADDNLTRVLRLQRAQLLETRRRYDEAEAAYQALVAAPNSQTAFRVAYGEFLERRRRRDEAVALYAAAPTADAANPIVIAARARAASGGRPPRLPTYRQGAARALLLASSLARDLRAHQFAVVYSRLALLVSPDDEYRLQYADVLVRARLEAPARQVLQQVGPGVPLLYTAAQAQMADSLARAGREDEALAAYRRALAASPSSVPANLALAGQLVSQKRNEEALELLNGPVLSGPAQAAFTRFLRGAAYEGVGRTSEAVAELQLAVAAQPDQPMFLNFLGYLWVDSGLKVDEGAAMIARAHGAQPADGNIQDSLGWAQFRQGRFDQAVDTLEQAVGKEPSNAEINDHLGDAYWRVGRRREASWQWRRVLTLDPDAERRAGAERKLAEGLPAEPAAAPTVAAADAT